MSRKFLVPAGLLASASDPSGTFTAGDTYYNTTNKAIKSYDGSTWVPMGVGSPATFSKSGALTTGTGTFRWYNDSGATRTITGVRASVGTAPSGSDIILDVNINGSTIWSTQANRVTITDSTNTASTTTFNTGTISAGDYITVDIDQIGSSTAGSDLTVQIWLS